MKVIIMRGLPGSGKSTWVRKYWQSMEPGTYPLVVSANDYFVKNGVYTFDPALVGPAHNRCLEQFVEALEEERRRKRTTGWQPDYHVIIVDNTNCAAWEIAPYYRLAQVYHCPVEIVHIVCDLETCCRRNVHQVPATTIYRMHRTLMTESLPAHWSERVVLSSSFDPGQPVQLGGAVK